MARGCDDEKPIVKQLLKYQTVGVPRGVLRAYPQIDLSEAVDHLLKTAA